MYKSQNLGGLKPPWCLHPCDGKVTKFGNIACHILGSNRKLIAQVTKVGSLYYLDCEASSELENVAGNTEKKDIWHR